MVTLADIAEFVERHGHCRDGDYQDEAGRVCVLGAWFRLAARADALAFPTDDPLYAALRNIALREGHSTVADWSDRTPTLTLLAQLRE